MLLMFPCHFELDRKGLITAFCQSQMNQVDHRQRQGAQRAVRKANKEKQHLCGTVFLPHPTDHAYSRRCSLQNAVLQVFA